MTDDNRTTALTPAMKRVLIAVAAIVVVGVIAAIWLFASTPGRAGTSADPGTSATATGDAAIITDAPTPTSGPLPEATPTTGTEVLPPTATPDDGLPPVSPEKPLVSAPLPASGSKQSGLVTGFPTKIMGPMAKSTVISSSIASQGTTMQVTLVARIAATRSTVEAHYEKLWSSLGLRPGRTADGSLSFAGAHESLTLAVAPTGTGNRYTIYGVFRTK